MKKLSLLITFNIVLLLFTACSFFTGSNENKKDKETVSIVEGNDNKQNISLYPAYKMLGTIRKWGFIDISGTFVIEPKYDKVHKFTANGIAVVSSGISESIEFRLIDKAGKTVAGPFYSSYYTPEFDDGYLVVRTKDNKSLVYNDRGEKVFETPYNIVHSGNDMFCFSQGDYPDTFYGFMDNKGNIVIPATFGYCNNFVGDKASVSLKNGKYAIINKKGEILANLNDYTPLVETTEGMEPFRDEASKKWGYRSKTGEIIVTPKFENVHKFQDGFAVVEYSTEEYRSFYGLIDLKGNFILKPEYIGIDHLGDGLFSACKGESYSLYFGEFFPKAIFDNTGNQLTPFMYYNVEKYNGEYASCSDGKFTFFIDKSGSIVENMVKVEGVGKLEINKDIIQANIQSGFDDGVVSYYTLDGKVIWIGNDTIELDGGIRVETLRYRRDYCTSIVYPQIKKLSSKSVEDTINKKLKEEFLGDYENTEKETAEDTFFASTEIKFLVEKNKDLLSVNLFAYFYPIGAAHGSQYDAWYHFDLKTGNLFELEDLFKKDAPYKNILSSIVSDQRRIDINIYSDIDFNLNRVYEIEVSKNQNFILSKDCLSIYYQPGEIDAYAAGFVTFDIPYGKIIDIINVDGEMWKAFDKEIKQHKVKYFHFDDKETSETIEKTMDIYQHSLVDAINNNDFSKVEAVLAKDSDLYNDQNKLVGDLFNQGIEEKLESFEIYAIKYDSENADYKIYVTEKIGLKMPQKAFETKQFSWCYTAKYDKEANSCKLSKIEKWAIYGSVHP